MVVVTTKNHQKSITWQQGMLSKRDQYHWIALFERFLEHISFLKVAQEKEEL